MLETIKSYLYVGLLLIFSILLFLLTFGFYRAFLKKSTDALKKIRQKEQVEKKLLKEEGQKKLEDINKQSIEALNESEQQYEDDKRHLVKNPDDIVSDLLDFTQPSKRD